MWIPSRAPHKYFRTVILGALKTSSTIVRPRPPRDMRPPHPQSHARQNLSPKNTDVSTVQAHGFHPSKKRQKHRARQDHQIFKPVILSSGASEPSSDNFSHTRSRNNLQSPPRAGFAHVVYVSVGVPFPPLKTG